MIEKFRLWLCWWLDIDELEKVIREHREYEKMQVERINILELANEQRLRELQELRTAMATFHVEQYRPPVAKESAKKVIATKNMREYNLIRERELQEMEDA